MAYKCTGKIRGPKPITDFSLLNMIVSKLNQSTPIPQITRFSQFTTDGLGLFATVLDANINRIGFTLHCTSVNSGNKWSIRDDYGNIISFDNMHQDLEYFNYIGPDWLPLVRYEIGVISASVQTYDLLEYIQQQ